MREFKSYYVVWKPEHENEMYFYLEGFKSYYVVWKLIGVGVFRRGGRRFKSYYVVWKPTFPTTIQLLSLV